MFIQGHPDGEAVKIKNNQNDPLVIAIAEALKLVAVDIQGIKLINSNESMPVRWVDEQGNSVTIGGGGTETDAVDIIDLLPSNALRNNNANDISLPDLKKYKRYVIQVFNATDQDIKIAPWKSAPVVLEDESIGFFATVSTEDKAYSWTIPKKDVNNNGLFFLNTLAPKSNGAGTQKVKNPDKLFETMYSVAGVTMVLSYKAVAAPTNGSLTIRFIGFKR